MYVKNIKNKKYLKTYQVLFPIENFTKLEKSSNIIDSKNTKREKYIDERKKVHLGIVVAKQGKFKIIDCIKCEYIHAIPFIKKVNLKKFYHKKFYNQKRKKNYFKNQEKDKIWWNRIFKERLLKFSKILKRKGKILDVGCGPGFFLKFAKQNGWKVYGIDPSIDAVNFGRKKLGIKIEHGEFSLLKKFKNIDVIYNHGVMEHLEDPINFINLAKKSLSKNGIIFTSVANDFSQIQSLALKQTRKPWWIIPPEHYNYFNISSIKNLMKKKFKIINTNVSFPIDFFILMGQNYIKNKRLGKKIHQMRVLFELNLGMNGFSKLKDEILKGFTKLKVGRQIDLICQKKA
mgnify:CR=1 FL=1